MPSPHGLLTESSESWGCSEDEAPADDRPRALIGRARAFARGEVNTADEIRRRFVGRVPAGEVSAPAAAAAARAAGQALAVYHMGAHALGAAAYAVEAVRAAAPDPPQIVAAEIHWQLTHVTSEASTALRTLPPVGENRAFSDLDCSPRAGSARSSAPSKLASPNPIRGAEGAPSPLLRQAISPPGAAPARNTRSGRPRRSSPNASAVGHAAFRHEPLRAAAGRDRSSLPPSGPPRRRPRAGSPAVGEGPGRSSISWPRRHSASREDEKQEPRCLAGTR